MEQEAVIYFYMVQETLKRYQPAKKHWWQRCELQVFSVPDRIKPEPAASREEPAVQRLSRDIPIKEDRLRLYACPVPCYSYKKKPWQPAQLDEAMEQAFSQVEGMADTVLSAEIRVLLGEDMSRKWEPRPDTLKMLTALRLEWDVRRLADKDRFPEDQSACVGKQYKRRSSHPAKAVIYLGAAQDADWQLQMAWELLQPYLPKLNHCVIRCETAAGESGSFVQTCSREESEAFAQADINSFAQACYYEYGLVVQTESCGEKAKALQTAERQAGARCLHLDFREENLYHSAVKYLDTIVKNSYYE